MDYNRKSDIIAYVDGSYNNSTKTVGYGIVFVNNNQIILKKFGIVLNCKQTSSCNVLGELQAAINAVEIAIANVMKKLTIAYDYEGIPNFVSGKYKAKKEVSKEYKSIMQYYSKHITISFMKIQAHSKNTYNDMADNLAKIGSNVQK